MQIQKEYGAGLCGQTFKIVKARDVQVGDVALPLSVKEFGWRAPSEVIEKTETSQYVYLSYQDCPHQLASKASSLFLIKVQEPAK